MQKGEMVMLEGGYGFTIGCRREYHFTIVMWYRNGRLKRLVGFCHRRTLPGMTQ